MNLAIFLNIKFYFDGERYTADERYFKFWTSFTEYFKKVVLCVPVLTTRERKGAFKVDLKKKRVEICHLPYYENTIELYKNSFYIMPQVKKIVFNNISEWDIVGAVVPNILGISILNQARLYSKPCFAYIRGNYKKSLYEFTGFKKIAAYLIAQFLELRIKNIIKNIPTFVVGEELYNKFQKLNASVFKIVVSLISTNDIVKEITIPARLQKIRLLNIGRLSPEKGVSYLIDGVYKMREKYGYDVTLTIVGSGMEESHLKEKIKKMGLNGCVKFLGYIPYNSEIINLYRNSDVFILPSLTEGVPKVILEALANGLPVIATSVGGIPEIIKDGENGILIPPADSEAIANAIHRLINNKNLIIDMIKKGLETIKEYTLEKQRERVIKILRSYYHFNN